MYGWNKANALGEKHLAKKIWEATNTTSIFKLLHAIKSINSPQSTEDLIHSMYLFICEKWESVPSFRNECMKYMHDLFFEATDNTFWGCGLDIKTIEKAKQREDFHAKQILSTLTGYNIVGWLVKVVSLLKSGGSLILNSKALGNLSPKCQKGLALVKKTLAEKGVLTPSMKGYTLVESKKKQKKVPLNTIL